MVFKLRKTQSLLMYSALIVVVLITLLIIQNYVRTKIEGVYKTAGDAFGEGEQ